MKRLIAAAVLCALLVLSALIPTAAGQIPSLYWNDDAWYRDAISPLVEKDGIYYVPAEMCAMFENVEVEMPRDDNVLVYNTETGGYISVLLNKNKAVLNGEIVETGSFRDGGACYVDVNMICTATGLIAEYLPDGDGGVALRLSDADVTMEFSELIEASRSENEREDDGDLSYDDPDVSDAKVLYIMCKADPGEAYSICDALEGYGLDFTCFVGENDPDSAIELAASHGEIGLIYGGDAGRTDALRDKCRNMTGRTARAVLYGDETIGRSGYAAITPDITVDGGGYAMGSIREVIGYLGDHDSCTIFVDKSWNGREFIRLVSELDRYTFETANISN